MSIVIGVFSAAGSVSHGSGRQAVVLPPQAGGSITVNGQVTAVDNATVTFDTPNLISNGDIVTNGQAVSFPDDLVLTSNLSIDTTGGGAAPAGANLLHTRC